MFGVSNLELILFSPCVAATSGKSHVPDQDQGSPTRRFRDRMTCSIAALGVFPYWAGAISPDSESIVYSDFVSRSV